MTIKARPVSATERLENEFYYGHRWALTCDEIGQEDWSLNPLSPADFLDPQLDDHFVQGTLHHSDVSQARSIFQYLYRDEPDIAVFSQLKMDWGIEGLSRPSPDIAVIPNVKKRNKNRYVFDVRGEGTQPTFVLEVVAPRFRQADRVTKVGIYQQARVAEYVIIDSGLSEETNKFSYEVIGYRFQDDVFTEIQPNERGWVFSKINNVWIGINETEDGFFIIDRQTGERILSAEERIEVAIAHAETTAAARAAVEARVTELEIRLRELEARSQTKS